MVFTQKFSLTLTIFSVLTVLNIAYYAHRDATEATIKFVNRLNMNSDLNVENKFRQVKSGIDDSRHVSGLEENALIKTEAISVNISNNSYKTIHLYGHMGARFHSFTGCSYNCVIKTGRNYQADADLVLILLTDLRMGSMPKGPRPEKQYWVFVSNESPTRTYINYIQKDTMLGSIDHVFNMTMSFMRDSDISIPYGGYTPRTGPITETWKSSDKDKLILWYISHCSIDLRRQYAQELNRHTRVDTYGACTAREDPCRMDKDCLMTFAGKYKFYLAFENSVCKDYITEKFWEALKYGMVPIALGARIEDYEALAPPNSYLHVNNFTSPRHLANYLKYLDKHPAVYNSYHAWRERYEIRDDGGWWWWYRRKNYEDGENGMWCKVCAAAHNVQGQRRSVSLGRHEWSDHRLCTKPTAQSYKIHNGYSEERGWIELGKDRNNSININPKSFDTSGRPK